ncbi:MAG: DNA-3-methyladenine glycosylase [Gammaproteobacteria bacterium]|nr:DNA-3-methyladenine glycosylase [Gammaproteobacteria bacterium]
MTRLAQGFFSAEAEQVAQSLLGKVIRRRFQGQWLSARIIETEAYYRHERASHSSLGYSHARRAMFMPAGIIYMYYARGWPSLNVSTEGEGDAVLIKSAYPWPHRLSGKRMIDLMQQAYAEKRPLHRLCAGQTLLCRALRLAVEDWNARQFDAGEFYIDDTGERPGRVIQTRRLGIAAHRDAHLPYRYIDYDYAHACTRNPLASRTWHEGTDYVVRAVRG